MDAELLPSLRDELTARLQQLNNRIMSLRAESEEVWKTLETAETTLLAMLEAKDFECASLFSGNADSTPNSIPKPPETITFKLRADRRETEEFYLTVRCLHYLWSRSPEVSGKDLYIEFKAYGMITFDNVVF